MISEPPKRSGTYYLANKRSRYKSGLVLAALVLGLTLVPRGPEVVLAPTNSSADPARAETLCAEKSTTRLGTGAALACSFFSGSFFSRLYVVHCTIRVIVACVLSLTELAPCLAVFAGNWLDWGSDGEMGAAVNKLGLLVIRRTRYGCRAPVPPCPGSVSQSVLFPNCCEFFFFLFTPPCLVSLCKPWWVWWQRVRQALTELTMTEATSRFRLAE